MMHALREEPGSYVRALGDKSEVIYAVCPSVGGFVAEWEYVPGAGEAARSQREDFSSYADVLGYLEGILTNRSPAEVRRGDGARPSPRVAGPRGFYWSTLA